MVLSPVAFTDSLRIGSIDFVSPNEIKVILDIEAPDFIALNTGYPHPFPRVNSYMLIPNEDGFLVGQIEWITVERSQYPKRKGIQDFGVIDLPYPLRKMSLKPLGNLRYTSLNSEKKDCYEFIRGVGSYPTVGDPVVLPTQTQLWAIVESGENRRVKIGVSPLAGNAQVCIDPDRLFGRHLAILGNTGSGKSCSVAGLIHWSLRAAKSQLNAETGEEPNARFIILDPNSEYCTAFREKARIFAVDPSDKKIKQLIAPLWLWNSNEWSAFTQASDKTQRPTLIQALRSVREGKSVTATIPSVNMKRYLRTLLSAIHIERNSGNPWREFPKPKGFYDNLIRWREGLRIDDSFTAEQIFSIEALKEIINRLIDNRSGKYACFTFSLLEIDELIELLSKAHSSFGGLENDSLPIDADIPRQFSSDQILRAIEANGELVMTTGIAGGLLSAL